MPRLRRRPPGRARPSSPHRPGGLRSPGPTPHAPRPGQCGRHERSVTAEAGPGRALRHTPPRGAGSSLRVAASVQRSRMAPTLLNLAHWSTWAVCAVIKLPQLAAVLAAGSARGVSAGSLLLELAGFLVFLRYQIYYGYPLQTYLEYPIIIAQDVILLLCILHFNGNKKRALFYAVTFWGGWYMLTLRKWIIDLALNLCTFISAASKLAQLRCLWETKDSGQVSALTWSMSAYTCATRIFTTIMTTNDLGVLIRFITMLILNIWVTATILQYRKTKKTD
ncbi:solute carrier family 66 member 3 [Strigops habroptila]|uniref:solute carrier family 66 member 3 n=1 Tax=Strigops habroptila TaxID=2489341 RepID=UPI0011CF2B80|nr:solute carrier family 66 member 3 [Strigops habroptila]